MARGLTPKVTSPGLPCDPGIMGMYVTPGTGSWTGSSSASSAGSSMVTGASWPTRRVGCLRPATSCLCMQIHVSKTPEEGESLCGPSNFVVRGR